MSSIDKNLNNIYEELTLEEGIVFLKNGKRIRNLIKKLRSKTNDINNEELKVFIRTLQRKARRFEKFEADFITATPEEKKNIKIKYKKFVKRNKVLVDKINSESFKKLLIVLGIIGLLATIIAVVFGLNSLFINKDDVVADDIKQDDEPTLEEKKEQLKLMNTIKKPIVDETPVVVEHPDLIELKKMIDKIAISNGVPPKLVKSIIQQESEWDIDNVSRNRNGTRDMGLMQLNSGYMEYYKSKFWPRDKSFNPLSAEDNVTLGTKYLAHLIKYYKGNLDLAIQAYNCGPTAVDAGKIPTATIAYLARVKRGI